MRFRLLLTCVLAVPAALSYAVGAKPLSAQACQWPQFHGPRRDNKSTETGLLTQWPEGGPTLLWTYKGLGHGFSSLAIANGLLYTTGNIGTDTVITALDLGGKLKWQVKNGPAYKRSHHGTRSTPTIDGDRLYHENADGDLVCLDARTGEKVWGLNILQKFGGRNISWGLAESVLIDGKKLIATPGGPEIGLAALDKANGETIWTCKGAEHKPGYASPVLVEYGGLRQVVTMLAKSIIGVNADTGKLLWQVAHSTPYDEHIFTPLFHDGHIYFATGHRRGSRLLKLNVQGDECSVDLVWSTDKLDNHHGGVILHRGYLYGFCHGNYKWRWECLDFKTGKLTYSERTPTKGSITYAEGLLYAMNEKGLVELIKPVPDARKVVSSFQIPKGGRGPTWAHPVICGGRLHIRHSDFLYVYDIKKP